MRVFITGVAGFLGSHLADAFIARGDRVVGVDNLIGGYADNVPKDVDWYQGDCNDFDRLKKAMRGVEVVYHCAATAHEGLSVFGPHQNAVHGYCASAAVFSAACATGVRRVVHCSSMARYGASSGSPPFTEDMATIPEDPYGIGKLASEALLRNLAETHGFEWAVAVPHNLYGPRQHFADPFRNVLSIFTNLMLQKRRPIIYGDGQQERSFSYYSDGVAPLLQMAVGETAKNQVINIGPDSEVVTVEHAARIVAKAVGVPFDPIYKPARPREVKFAHCSADKARRLLGYNPQVSLVDGIGRTVEWIRQRGPKPFSYHAMSIEIESPAVPETWAMRLF